MILFLNGVPEKQLSTSRWQVSEATVPLMQIVLGLPPVLAYHNANPSGDRKV